MSYTASSQISGGSPTQSLSGDLFQLDSVVFDEVGLEVPEALGNVGGTQSVEEHRYPGGIITHQTFGAFPGPLTWHGMFTGSNAFSRMQQVDLIRISGREVLLRFGPKAWMGRVQEFAPTVHHRWMIAYSIKFMPRVDISNAVPAQPTTPPETQLADQTTALDTLATGNPFPMPSTLVVPVNGLLTVTAQALAGANGVVDAITAADAALIQTAVDVVTLAANPLLQSVLPLVSFMALSCLARATTIGQITQAPTLPAATALQLVNPNLPMLAAQYFGDATKWLVIAQFNGLLDPLPIGAYVINIPNVAAAS